MSTRTIRLLAQAYELDTFEPQKVVGGNFKITRCCNRRTRSVGCDRCHQKNLFCCQIDRKRSEHWRQCRK
jgi:hypothetical protein